MERVLTFRWLGAGGIELRTRRHVLLIDPYFSRIPWWNVLFGKLRSRPEEIRKHAPSCDNILVTHAHFDHLMDVPTMVASAGPAVYGSWNTIRLLSRYGLPKRLIREVKGGDKFDLGDFKIQVYRAWHLQIPGFSAHDVPVEKEPPRRAREFRMDVKFAFHIRAEGLSLLTDPGRKFQSAARADVLFLRPDLNRKEWAALLGSIRPRVVIPIHWESHHRPLDKPIRPAFRPPGWRFPPLARFHLERFGKMIEKEGVRFFVPEILKPYPIHETMERSRS